MKSILKKVKEDKIRFVELNFTDIFGTLKSIEIPVESLPDALQGGVWFDGSSIKGFTRIKESDMYLKPDLSTYALLPGEDSRKKTARFICDIFTPNQKLYHGSPRTVLKKIMQKAREKGFEFKVGPEIEFYLFKTKEDGSFETPKHDTGSYFDSSAGDLGSDLRKEIMVALKGVGIDSERAHHEVGVGQHEIGFRYDNPLTTADRVVTLKKTIKTIAHQHGLVASFMPKPLFKKPGNGMHIHFSLFDLEDNPLFYDENDKLKLSPLAKHFIAGELRFVKEMCAILNPTVNSYKRLVAGYEAPVYICWGSKNRSALVRVPHFTEGKKSSVRAELRCPDPSASPYLAFAAMLAAGLEGVHKKLPLEPELEDNAFVNSKGELEVLPASLDEAITSFRKSNLMKELLGEELFDKFLKAKEKEAEEFRIAVTDWEVKTYLEKG